MLDYLKKNRIIILGFMVFIFSYIYVCIAADTYDYSFSPDFDMSKVTDFAVEESDKDILRLDGWDVDDKGIVTLHLKSLSPGRAMVDVISDENVNANERMIVNKYYVHKNGMITVYDYYGPCQVSIQLNIIWTIYLVVVFLAIIGKYIREVKRRFYRYSNVLYLSLLIFMCFNVFFKYLMSFKVPKLTDMALGL